MDRTYSLQLELPIRQQPSAPGLGTGYRERLRALLSGDLDFHGKSSAYASHNLHSFPAKFPPQLPRKFIEGLTDVGGVILDPMVGSGTTVVEAFLARRVGIGFDIDPLALRLCKVKTTPLPLEEIIVAGNRVLQGAAASVQRSQSELCQELSLRFGEAERKFVDYWFLPSTQFELVALVREIDRVSEQSIREFLELTFSATIITKSGVSMARDLAHTRPHRVRSKVPRSALDEFRKRLSRNVRSLPVLARAPGEARVSCGNALALPLANETVDLVVTSPPIQRMPLTICGRTSSLWCGLAIH